MPPKKEPGYGLMIGFIYIFNIIVGTGALTMPKAFEYSGILLSSVLLVVLTLMSFITATFMFEAMSIANAIKNYPKYEGDVIQRRGIVNPIYENENIQRRNENLDAITNEDRPLINDSYPNDDDDAEDHRSRENKKLDKIFDIQTKFEMGEMAALFFNKIGQFFFYLAMILYLYGDLAIYDAAVPKSLRDTICTYYPKDNSTLTEDDPCWSAAPTLSRMNSYRICVVLFNLLVGPLVFGNVQKTKLLQMATSLMRWIAFITIITLAFIKINDNTAKDISMNPTLVNIKGVPNFFGACIYAFMCHHSLPSIITPMNRKKKYLTIFISAYSCIMVFYFLVSYTGAYAFGKNLEDFYTLNFLPDRSQSNNQSVFLKIIDYYLSLFPVFTISASFPIIAITLRNNLKSLYFFIKPEAVTTRKSYFINYGLPLITLIPPLGISLITLDLQFLVGITGSYAGVAIQYIIPSCLVYFGRRVAIRTYRVNFQKEHSYSSPFSSKYWVYFVLLWSNLAVIFVTVNHIISGS